MQESTQTGDSAMSVDDAAAKLMARYDAKAEPQEPEEAEETIEEEVTDEVETESESEEVDAEEAEAETFQSLEELAEATGMEFEDFLKTIKAKTKVKGEEAEVSLADVIKGYQLESDYTRKNEAFLNQQREWEQQRQREQAELQQHLQRTGQAFRMAQEQLTHEFNAIDWKSLEKDDPQAYLLKRQQFGERQAQIDHAINQATQNAQMVMQKQRQQQQQQLDAYTKQQDELLVKALPSWNKPEVRKAESEKVAQFLMDSGYSAEEVGNIRDHRVILMAVNAMKGSKVATEADIAEKKVKQAPKLVKSGARQSVNQAKATQTAKLVKKAKQTGRTEDIAAALLSRRS